MVVRTKQIEIITQIIMPYCMVVYVPYVLLKNICMDKNRSDFDFFYYWCDQVYLTGWARSSYR
jgi:hypothetical protein